MFKNLSLSRFLKIRESEKKLVGDLFIFEFFQGAAIALFFTAAITLFLQDLKASEIPKVFVLSAFILWGFSFIYNKLEHALSTKKLIILVLVFNTIAILLFRVLLDIEGLWFLYAMLAFYYLLYLLNNLEFWGLVALFFDVRQSKRLFAIVSGGDIPAKMIGYLVAAFLVPIFGTPNLLWIAFSCMLIALGIFIKISNSKDFQKITSTHNNNHHHHHHQKQHFATENINTLISTINNSKLIRTLSIVSFFSFCFYLVSAFVFYGFVKKAFHSDNNMASFFGIFLAASRGLTLIIKLVFTNRLLDKIGLKSSLMITPVFLMFLCIVTFIVSGIASEQISFYLFGIMAISIDVLKSSIQSPVMLATLQPLPVQQRLRGHTLIKGLMDPFAFFVIGVGLVFAMNIQKELNFRVLSLVLFVISLLWFIFSFFVEKHYIHMLTNAIRRRVLNERNLTITDKDSINILLEKLENGDENDAIAILNLMNEQDDNPVLFFEKALQHDSHVVRHHALEYIKNNEDRTFLPLLKQMLLTENEPMQLAKIISTISILDKYEDISSFFDHEDEIVINATVIAILNNPENSHRKIAFDHLNFLLNDELLENKLKALRILKGLNNIDSFSDNLIKYLDITDSNILDLTLDIISKSGNNHLIENVFTLFLKSNDTRFLHALYKAGNTCLPLIEKYLLEKNTDELKRRRLIKLLAKTGGDESTALLIKLITFYPNDDDITLQSLYQLHFRSITDQEKYQTLLMNYLKASSLIMFQLEFLNTYKETYSLVIRALEIELENIKKKCLFVFTFLYDENKIRRAISGFELNSRESAANSFELIEMTVNKEFANVFCILYESKDLSFKCAELFKLYKFSSQLETKVLAAIMDITEGRYNDWTKASTLYSLREKPLEIKTEFFLPYKNYESQLVAETASLIDEVYKSIKTHH